MHPVTSSSCLACLLAGLLSAPVLRAQDSASNTLPIPPLPTAAPRTKVPEPAEVTATVKPAEVTAKAPHVSSISPDEIEGYDAYPAPLQTLITEALALTKLNLRYQFGSADPKSGGMDCSGTIYHLLHKLGVSDVPRQSSEVCDWTMRQSMLYRTEHVGNLKDPAFSALKPGDLLFWTGTYESNAPRSTPVTHVMIYLGKRKENGKPVIFGASDGRSFDGERQNGVSVFDFPLPKAGSPAEFYGYAPLPSAAWEKIRGGKGR